MTNTQIWDGISEEMEFQEDQFEEDDQRFDELKEIGENRANEEETVKKNHEASDLKFSYEELAKEAEKLQQRCMELSQCDEERHQDWSPNQTRSTQYICG